MKKAATALCLLFSALTVSATSFYDQLCTFNFNWKKYAMLAPEGEARNFSSDREYIQAHLTHVLAILHAAPVAHLTPEQRSSRAHLLALLDGYRLDGKFPMNYYRRERIPVFIDEHGTHCAVGYLMLMTGEEEMAQRISKADNYAWVKDIRDPGVAAWQQASGLSVEDLKLIQGAYDSYLPDAFFLPNKYETPQMPICTTAYFTDKASTKLPKSEKEQHVWCKGEGKNGVLNGRWEQNYAPGMPWIVGFYENGKRTGDWEEYYQGTKQLCRTEQWRDHKLNGIRKRFDRSGNLIEEILFSDGKAICKINYELNDSLAYVRIRLDSVRVETQVLNAKGEVIARGHETIHNPGNLQWFQNIELTALNSASISAQSINVPGGDNNGGLSLDGGYATGGYGGNIFSRVSLYNTPPLVQYKKEGDWMYYPDRTTPGAQMSAWQTSVPCPEFFSSRYAHFGPGLFASVSMFENVKHNTAYDSIRITYTNNHVRNFFGYSATDYVHLHLDYYNAGDPGVPVFVIMPYHIYPGRYSAHSFEPAPLVKTAGQYNREGQRTGEWKYYKVSGALYKTENFLIPTDEEGSLSVN